MRVLKEKKLKEDISGKWKDLYDGPMSEFYKVWGEVAYKASGIEVGNISGRMEKYLLQNFGQNSIYFLSKDKIDIKVFDIGNAMVTIYNDVNKGFKITGRDFVLYFFTD